MVGAKPINAMVDLTNYVMFDVGHPMHVFDAAAFADNAIIIRAAQKSEQLQLLDGRDVKLEPFDIVSLQIKISQYLWRDYWWC